MSLVSVPSWTTSSQDWIFVWLCLWLIQEELWTQAELTQGSYTSSLSSFLLSLPLAASAGLLPWELWTCGTSQSSKRTGLGVCFSMKQVKWAAFSRNCSRSFSNGFVWFGGGSHCVWCSFFSLLGSQLVLEFPCEAEGCTVGSGAAWNNLTVHFAGTLCWSASMHWTCEYGSFKSFGRT